MSYSHQVFRNCPYQALLENKSEGRFVINVLKTHLDPYISFPLQAALCSPSLPALWAEHYRFDLVPGESKIRGYLDWGGGGEETSGTVGVRIICRHMEIK